MLRRAKTLVWNGPFGAFELPPFDTGTVAVAKAAAALTRAGKLVTVAGGGDTVAALNAAGVAGDLTYVSTAGGAFLEWLEGKSLPGVAALRRTLDSGDESRSGADACRLGSAFAPGRVDWRSLRCLRGFT